jgi:hypothetical protein
MTDRHSSMDVRDPFVTRALATLPIPEHAPDFWPRLEAALEAVRFDDVDESPAHEPPLAVHIARQEVDAALPSRIGLTGIDLAAIVRPGDDRVRPPRRLSRVARPLLAAAAVVLLVAAVRLSVDGDDDAVLQSVTLTGPDGSSTPAAEPGRATSSSTAIAGDVQQATSVLNTFLEALGAGRTADAAKLVGPRSEAYLISQGGSVQAGLPPAGEGYGAWAASPDRTLTAVQVAPGSFVLVAEGTVQVDGRPTHRVDAFPMTKAESARAWFVDAWAFDPAIGGRLELSGDASSGGIRALRVGEPVEVFAEAPGTMRFVLAGHEPIDVVTVKRGAANLATWTPTAADIGDAQLLTIAFRSDSGTIYTALAVQAQVR